MEKNSRVLFIQTAFIGDLLLSIPTLKLLKDRFQCHITLVCRPGLEDLVLSLGLADEVRSLNKQSFFKKISRLGKMSAGEFDYLFCPHESSTSWVLAGLTRARLKVGAKGTSLPGVFHHRVDKRRSRPEALRQMALLAEVSAEVMELITSWDEKHPHATQGLSLSDVKEGSKAVPLLAQMGLRERLRSLLEKQPEVHERIVAGLGLANSKPAVFLAPGSVWTTKQWTKEGYIELAQRLSRDGFDIIWIGSPVEKSLCQRLQQASTGRVLAGEWSLLETACALTEARALISNDSGAMHLAAVAETPTVSIFGPTVLEFGYRPWQNQAVVVDGGALPCRPCGSHGHKKCPIETHECMKRISAQQVDAALRGLLAISGPTP